MIALWLTAGLLAGQSAAPVLRRGDDGGARERFWRAKQEEWLEQTLERVTEAVRRPRKARKRFVADFLREVDEKAPEAPEIASRLDDVMAALVAPVPDYTALAAMVAAHMAEIEAQRVQRRRKRDLEAVLLLAA